MMLDFYGWATPNSNRVSIMLEELGLSYRVHPVNIRRREQFAPEILALNPYGKIPILVDASGPETLVLFESGAILIHLAEQHGQFLPTRPRERAEALKWLMVALTSAGPFTGQAHHWTELAAERPEVAVRHHVGLVARVYRVLDQRLAVSRYLADDYSIADIALYPWIARHLWAAQSLDDTPALGRWYEDVGARPAVIRGMQVPAGAKLE
jgi:GST-like protein